MPGMEPWGLRGFRCDPDRYVACPHCAGPINVELPILRYANRLALAVDGALEYGGAAALPQIKDMVHDFVVNTNTPIMAAEMDDAWFGKIANTTHDIWSAYRHKEAKAAQARGKK